MEYLEALDYLYSLENSSVKLGLDNVRDLLKRWGNPQSSFPAIHIGGTNGKGSTCSIISSILTSAGYKTGLYTSPHLQSFVERIQIDNEPIPPKRLGEWIEDAAKIAERMDGEPTVFEVTTAVAFKHFEEEKVDIAVVEVGMGGRLDATNTVNPIVTGVTNVELDHQRSLGDHRAKIAFEKGSIAKPGVPMVLGDRSAEVHEVIGKLCREVGAPLYLNDVYLKREELDKKGQTFEIAYKGAKLKVRTSLLGNFQVDNLRMALKMIDVSKLDVKSEFIVEGLSKTKHPGRMERVSEDPLVVLDGAHNPSKIDALISSLEDFFPGEFVFVFGVMRDKDVESMLRKLGNKGKRFYLTRVDYHRSMELVDIARILSRIGNGVSFELSKDPGEALERAIENGERRICVTGSLYVAGYLRSLYHEPIARDNHNF
jgi:dihydrofolate synthase/folylpolyglutamate synthase